MEPTIERQKPTVFLSYAHEDQAAASRLALMLAEHDLDVWFDQTAIAPGDSVSQQIDQGLRSARAVLVLISRRSQRSVELPLEAAAAVAARVADPTKLVVPVLIDDNVAVPPLISDVQGLRLTGSNVDVAAAVSALADRIRNPRANERDFKSAEELVRLQEFGLDLERRVWEGRRADLSARTLLTLGPLIAVVVALAAIGIALFVGSGASAVALAVSLGGATVAATFALVQVLVIRRVMRSASYDLAWAARAIADMRAAEQSKQTEQPS